MSLSTALNIGISGLQYSQAGLSTVSHNVVNANTPGYSRQVTQAGSVSYNGFGAGVNLDTIQRITDQFLTTRVLTAGSDLSHADTRQNYLQSIEGIFSGASMQDLSNGLFAALSNLTNAPSDSALRRNVVQSASLLTDTIRSVHDDLNATQTRVDQDINADIANMNVALKRIYDLNVAIAQQSSVINGGNTNDLQDARDAQVAELAKHFKVNVTSTANGSLRVLTENGRKLVDEGSYVQLARGGPNVNGFAGIVTQNVRIDGSLDPSQVPVYTDGLTSGSLKALVDMRDVDIPNFIAQVDEFTEEFTTAFNKVSSRGNATPPVNSLSSANTTGLATINTDLYANLDPALAGATFNASVVDSNGNPVFFAANTAPGVLGATTISTNGSLPEATYTIHRVDATHVELWDAANAAKVGGTNTVTIVQPAVGSQVLDFGQGLTITANNTLDISGVADGAAAGTITPETTAGGTPITLPGAGPFSLAQLAALINGNANVGNTTVGGTGGITATATVDGLGRPLIRLQTQAAGQYVVLSNVSGDVMGALGFNNFFSGTDSNSVTVNPAYTANPELLPLARMRADGGLSSLNNENVLAMSQMAETKITFAAAGGIGNQTVSGTQYLGQITSNLATVLNDANSRQVFADNVNNQVTQLKGSVSGVNINEELSQMLVFQNSFQASSRIITVVNDMFESLLAALR